MVLAFVLFAVACGSGAGPKVTIGKDIELSLARGCVAAGDEQVLTVHAPHPALAGYLTTYSDGQSGGPKPNGGGYGGEGLEIVPESGVVEMKWRVSHNAPPGPVTVSVRLQQASEKNKDLKFTLVGPGKSC